jgi:hypothetical protein
MLDDLDRAIDEVAREITSGNVDGDFARRVSVRLKDADAEAVRPTRVWSRAWLLVSATACVAVLAVFLAREVRQSRPSFQQSPQSPSAVRFRPDATVATAGAAAAATSAAAVTTAAGPKPVDTSPAALSVAMLRDPDFEPLTTAPIEMASLDVSPLTGVMPIEIAAIAIDRIEIAAMP